MSTAIRYERPAPVVSPTSTVTPFPLLIKRQHFKFLVRAIGTERSVWLTSDETVALRCLLKERVIWKALERLKTRHAQTTIAYTELVERLIDARLIHEVDGCEIEPPYASHAALIKERVKQGLASVPAGVSHRMEILATHLLPLRWVVTLNGGPVRMLFPKKRRQALTQQVQRQMARVCPYTPRAEVQRHAERFMANHLRTIAELVMLQVAPDDRVSRWVRRAVTDCDTAALRDALARGRGAILFNYHMGPIQYIPTILSALGFQLTILGMSMARARRTRMYFSIVDDLRPAGIMKLLRALERGEVVVMAPDHGLQPVGANADASAERARLFAGAWEKGSRVPVRFLGDEMQTYAGLAWLHEQSGAPLVHGAIHRNEDGTVGFRCSPFDVTPRGAMSAAAWRQRIMADVYQRYEDELFAQPHQWTRWMTFFRDHGHAAR